LLITSEAVLFVVSITVSPAQTPQHAIIAPVAFLLMTKDPVHHVLETAPFATILNNVSTAIQVRF